jgi:hypothetical protein
MPLLTEITPDFAALVKEIDEFRDFLMTNPRGERNDFLPFFRQRQQLCAFLATLNYRVQSGTHVKAVLELWGDFVCDLATGNPKSGAFVLVEFEDASPRSLFQPKPRRKNSVWGQRTEQAVSQVNDWLFRLHSEGPSDQMTRDFGARHVNIMGVIVVGRSSDVSHYDRVRLDWRSQNSIIGGSQLSIFTYDDLLEWLDGRITMIRGQL